MSLPALLRALGGRFDAAALRAPAAAAVGDDEALLRRDPDTHAALRRWCLRGAGPGGAAWWRPGAMPAVDRRLAVGWLAGTAPARAWADAFARQLDGSHRLQALPGAGARLAWRLQVKRDDATWWRRRHDDDPWDAGWVLDTPAALSWLQAGFRPRRATLLLADADRQALLGPALAALAQRRLGLRHPLRWLWVGAAAPVSQEPPAPLARFSLA